MRMGIFTDDEHTYGKRRELQLRGYQIHQGITALLAWHYRTGGDLSRYFGEWEPPNRGSVSRT